MSTSWFQPRDSGQVAESCEAYPFVPLAYQGRLIGAADFSAASAPRCDLLHAAASGPRLDHYSEGCSESATNSLNASAMTRSRSATACW